MGLGAAFSHFRNTLRTSGLLWTSSLVLDHFGVPALGWWEPRAVTVERLRAQIASILRGWGMNEEHIAISVEHILYADLHGIDSHGCAMLADYHKHRAAGRITMTPVIQIVRESPTTALIDGGGGLGHVPADVAMKLAIKKCQESGVAAVTVRNSGHYGAAGAYAAMAAREGLLGMAMTNTRTPSVVPALGVQAMLGTNPIAFSAPAKTHPPFLLDMATSTAPVGKVMVALRSGNPIPTGWAIDPRGRPVTRPRAAAKHRRLTPLGSTRPMGSHKGYGLGSMVEILSSLLPGLRAAQGPGGELRVGHFFLAIDPKQFRDDGDFQNDLDSMIDAMHGSKPADSRQPVLVAGDPEYTAQRQRGRAGIPLTRSVIEDIRLICRDAKVPFALNG